MSRQSGGTGSMLLVMNLARLSALQTTAMFANLQSIYRLLGDTQQGK